MKNCFFRWQTCLICAAGEDGRMENDMDYLEMIKGQNKERIALIEDGVPYTYGMLVAMAEDAAGDAGRQEKTHGDIRCLFQAKENGKTNRDLFPVCQDSILDQLLHFFAGFILGKVPVLLPSDQQISLPETEIPERACMAVTTSGTTGEPRLLFRSYESWADFFPIQNQIFGIHEDSRLFLQGSLAFTGNLNLCLAQMSVGGTVVAQNGFQPKQWEKVMKQEKVDVIYLIPSKLMCLPQVMRGENPMVKRILSGSQSLGKRDALRLKQYFPESEIILYYGASELSYVTYVTDRQMNGQDNLVGKPFPGVQVWVKEGKIYVDTSYRAEGIPSPCSLSDRGEMDREGNLYFHGRGEDFVEIHGRKVSIRHIENEVCALPEIQCCAVLTWKEKSRTRLIAFVCMGDQWQSGRKDGEEKKGENEKKKEDEKEQGRFLGEIRDKDYFAALRKSLAAFEMPNRMILVRDMPQNASGKIDKKILKQEWGRK